MKIETIAEHSFDLETLPAQANILDLGCRGFLFCNYMRDQGHRVIPVDADWLDTKEHYLRYAVTNKTGWVSLEYTGDPQGTRISKFSGSPHTPAITLEALSKELEIKFWDLIKIDIEGAEYEVIMSLIEPPAKQLSIEFHLHTKIYTQQEMADMENKLHSLGYVTASHQMTEQHGMGYNYWDSLFILRD